MRTREQLRIEIEQRLGVVPPLFESLLATASPEEVEAAWLGTLALWSGQPSSPIPAADSLTQNTRLLALGADVGIVLTTRDTLRDMLQGCAEALVTHLDAAFARVWLLGADQAMLELEASAGLYTHLDGPHGRVPVGEFKIGRIAQSREPHLTNDVLSDPNVSDPAWAAREGMVAFAGYPLLLDDALIGVVALFARHELSDATLRALESVANEIAVGIKRKQTEAVLKHNEEELRRLFNTMTQGVIFQDAEGYLVGANPAAEKMLGMPLSEMQGRHSTDPRWRAIREDGSPYPGEEHPPMVALKTGLPQHDGLMGLYNPSLNETRWFSMVSTPQFRDGETRPYQVYSIVEDVTRRKRLEQEQGELLDAARARAERESLINRISQEIRAEFDPDEIQAIAVKLLAEALGADRSYTCNYDFDNDAITVVQEWRRPDLAPMAGNVRIKDVAAIFESYYGTAHTRVIDDAQDVAFTEEVQAANDLYRIRARLSVALPGGSRSVVPTLNVAMADEPRVWTADEVQLVETVAALTRSAMESARLRQRERNIATQLQQALQPDVPESIPGLALARYYEAALEEAGVGGDFYDVFAVDKGCTALIVGDLSGKGLAAASQVATVRNMLRAVLYLGIHTADAVTTLNDLLAAHNLLNGFATLFVGMFDSNERSLTYVNCGQDPALLRRAATGEIEYLGPTGTVLGTFESAVYTQSRVALQPGDALAIFTDGLTEAGPSRRQLLGIGGVAALLQAAVGAAAESRAGAVAEALIERVQSYAAAGARDDICLLLGVVNGGGSDERLE